MNETTALPAEERPRPFHLEWVLPTLIRPRQTFGRIAAQSSGVWLTAILLLSLTTILRVLVAGAIRLTNPMGAQITPPPDFQYWSPEQQAQFMQAAQATSSPVFVFIFPAIGGVLGVWIGWLVVSGLLHLILTLQGGRAGTQATANIVAWAALPFALRDLVRAVAMLASSRPITSPGLSGFIAADATGLALFAAKLLALVDLYLIWHAALIVTGVRAGDGGLSRTRTWVGVAVTLLLVLAVQALLGYLGAQISNMTVMRPFFF